MQTVERLTLMCPWAPICYNIVGLHKNEETRRVKLEVSTGWGSWQGIFPSPPPTGLGSAAVSKLSQWGPGQRPGDVERFIGLQIWGMVEVGTG